MCCWGRSELSGIDPFENAIPVRLLDRRVNSRGQYPGGIVDGGTESAAET